MIYITFCPDCTEACVMADFRQNRRAMVCHSES